MNKAESFFTSEKNEYGKIYYDLNLAIDNISGFLSDEELKKRLFISKIPVLKKYIESLDASIAEVRSHGFFKSLSDDKYIDLIKDYKLRNKKDLDKLENCSKCACRNCMENCKFDGCIGCRDGAYVKSCDHEKICVVSHSSFFLNLTNNDTGDEDRYSAIGTIQDISTDKRYIAVQNIRNGEKFILYYYPGVVEDNYGEITNEREFDFIVQKFDE